MSSVLTSNETKTAPWTFLSSHGQVLLCIAEDPGIRVRDIGERVGMTERGAHRIIGELVEAGYVLRERRGRRNHYAIAAHLPLPGPLGRDRSVGDLLAILTQRPDRA
jgi:Winged helix-turn-helix DNA-binding